MSLMRGLAAFALTGAAILFGGTEEVKSRPSLRWVAPTRVATAVCSEFKWVGDLPISPETVQLYKKWSTTELGMEWKPEDHFANGSAEEFGTWLANLAKPKGGEEVLIVYFSTHQKKDGSLKFTKGKDLPGKELIRILNLISTNYTKVVLINDSCYAAGLEKCGNFDEKIIRLHASNESEIALDFDFARGPFGLAEFTKGERTWLAEKYGWKPMGMSFLGLMFLKAGFQASSQKMEGLDLVTLFKTMQQHRDQYDANIRQARAQHLALKPEGANLPLILKPAVRN